MTFSFAGTNGRNRKKDTAAAISGFADKKPCVLIFGARNSDWPLLSAAMRVLARVAIGVADALDIVA